VAELTGVGTAELYSWQSGIALVRAMASRLDDSTPAGIGDWLNSCEAVVTGEIGRRSR
jgi:hypothetical protein